MMRYAKTAVLLTAFFLFSIVGGCGCDEDPAGPEDDGNGNGNGGTAYATSPFRVMRHGVNLNGIWGASLAFVTVGDDGRMLSSVVAVNRLVPTGVTNDLNDVWSGSDGVHNVAFAVGDGPGAGPGVVLRFSQSQRYTESPPVTGHVTAVDGSSPSDVYITDTDGRVVQWNGASWQLVHQTAGDTPLYDVWVGPGGIVYVCGQDEIVAREGGVWSTAYTSSGNTFWAIDGIGPDSLFAVGNQGITMHAENAWYVDQPTTGDVRDVSWAAEDWAVAVADSGVAWVYDGSGWSPSSVGSPRTLTAVGASKIGGVGTAVAVSDSGGTYVITESGSSGGYSPSTPWTDIGGASADMVYGICGGRMFEYDGDWTTAPRAGNLQLSRLWVLAEDRVWAVGRQLIDLYSAYWDGSSWRTSWLSSMHDARDMWASDAYNVFVACDYGTVWRYNGSSWSFTQVLTPVQHLYGVWGVSLGSVFVVGENGTIVYWNNSTWTKMTSGTTAHLNAIWGSSSINIVAVGNGGTVLRYDGTAWSALTTGFSDDLTMVWCDVPGNIWAAAATGKVFHYDGSAWQQLSTGLPEVQHNAMWGSSGNDVWIGCDEDFLLRYAP